MIFNKLNSKFGAQLTLFLECLLCCSDIDKFGIDLFGSKIETTLFNDMKWDVKQYDNINEKEKNKNFEKISTKNINSNNNTKYCLIQKKIYDIFPKNYYKLSESSKKTINKPTKKNSIDMAVTFERNKNPLIKSKSDLSNS